MQVLPKGVRHIPGCLDTSRQQAIVEALRVIVRAAPLYTPTMPKTGKLMSVRMTNCGALGWVTDKVGGYRYQPNHPATGAPWPDIPAQLLALWDEYSGYHLAPEACLINFYDSSAHMGMHQDRDEENFDAPVLSISLGDSCLFRVGETTRQGRTTSLKLASGDLIVLGGAGRLCYHGVDRIYPSTSALLKNGGRINLTLRRVTKP
jgi:alkylated DNA repair protein (DNA oxidative demethylase)